MQMKCSVCGTVNPEGAKFCRICGKELGEADIISEPDNTITPGQGADHREKNISSADALPKKCDKCGTVITGEAKFCRNCGTKIKDAESRKETVVEQEKLHIDEMSKAAAEVSTTDISQNPTSIKGVDDPCPYCGANGCQMVQRTSTKIKQSSYG